MMMMTDSCEKSLPSVSFVFDARQGKCRKSTLGCILGLVDGGKNRIAIDVSFRQLSTDPR